MGQWTESFALHWFLTTIEHFQLGNCCPNPRSIWIMDKWTVGSDIVSLNVRWPHHRDTRSIKMQICSLLSISCLEWDELLPPNASFSSLTVKWAWSDKLRYRCLHETRWFLPCFSSVLVSVSAQYRHWLYRIISSALTKLSVSLREHSYMTVLKRGEVQIVLHSWVMQNFLWCSIQNIHFMALGNFCLDGETQMLDHKTFWRSIQLYS